MFSIDYRSRVPLYRQIVENVEKLAARGILAPDAQLPSVRGLAVDLSLNPNTVSRAYSELEAKGVIYSLPGRGNFVTADSAALKEAAQQQILQQLIHLAKEAAALSMDQAAWLLLCKKAWPQVMEKEDISDDRSNSTAENL